MQKIQCSVAMLTFNSEKTLRRTLESVKDFDEIVLCDGGSTDGTAAIAAEYGARIIPQDKKYKYENNALADGGGARNQMMEATKHDWYLWLDSDETISPGLHDEVKAIVERSLKEGDPLAYRVPIGMVVDGRPIKYSSNYPGYQFRFFNKKSGGRLVRRAHNRIEFDPGTVIGTLKNPWYTYHELATHRVFLGVEKKHYRRVEIEEACSKPFGWFVYFFFWHLRAAAGLFLKASYMYLRHGFKDTMPLRIEFGRFLSPLIFISRATWCRVKRTFGLK